jgi:TM2 domain-containing membrane protein YozV
MGRRPARARHPRLAPNPLHLIHRFGWVQQERLIDDRDALRMARSIRPSSPVTTALLRVTRREQDSMAEHENTHSLLVGYILWIFGFLGAHRFYFGRPISGTIYFFTLGLLGIGWLVDLFLMPSLERSAQLRFNDGPLDYTVAWVLLTFVGILGIHRFYQEKWLSGALYLVSGGLFGFGLIYDFWTLNDQISLENAAARRR